MEAGGTTAVSKLDLEGDAVVLEHLSRYSEPRHRLSSARNDSQSSHRRGLDGFYLTEWHHLALSHIYRADRDP